MAGKTVKSVDIYDKNYEVSVDSLSRRPSAYGIVNKDGKILLSPQFSDNRYDLPGDGVELGETLEEAVIREVKGETGLIVASQTGRCDDKVLYVWARRQ